MQIVIDIPDAIYEIFSAVDLKDKNWDKKYYLYGIAYTLLNKLQNGTPLAEVIEGIKGEIENRIDYCERMYGHQIAYADISAYKRCLKIIDEHISSTVVERSE